MANPPITIGPFTTVPAPGSAIRSPWAQQITNFVNDRFPNSLLMKTGQGSYPTNANADALIGFAPAFPTTCTGLIVTDVSSTLDVALIVKVMSINVTTGVVRIYLHDGSKVTSNGAVALSWVAFGR